MPVRWISGGGYLGNSYISGNVLIDAAVRPDVVAPYRDEIDVIALTHCHYDHIAYAKEIAYLCNATICIHDLDAAGLQDDSINLSSHFGARSPGIVPDRLLQEGDMVKHLRILHTPGHTPGSICLYDEDEASLISGDTVFCGGGFGRFDFFGGSRTQLAHSLERLASMDIEGLYPGHGTPVETGGARHIASARELMRLSYG